MLYVALMQGPLWKMSPLVEKYEVHLGDNDHVNPIATVFYDFKP